MGRLWTTTYCLPSCKQRTANNKTKRIKTKMDTLISKDRIKKSGIKTYEANLNLYNSGILTVKQFNDLLLNSDLILKSKSEYTIEENETEFIIRVKKDSQATEKKGFTTLCKVGNLMVTSNDYINDLGICLQISRKS
jgi:hypothetical protein